MNTTKKALMIVALALTCGAYTSNAQIEVKVRPERPHYERTAAPSPRHVWIDEDWRSKGSGYEFSGGHWAEPPHPGARWHGGHWKKTHKGEMWVGGSWK